METEKNQRDAMTKAIFIVGMSSMMLHPLLCLGGQSRSGTIQGSVLDARGTPIVAVHVHAESLNGKPMSSIVKYVETDSTGHFMIADLEWGTYTISTSKESEDYPDTSYRFYHDAKLPQVSLSATRPSAIVTLHLDKKAAKVEGTLSDSTSGNLLSSGSVRLWRKTDPNLWIQMAIASKFSLFVPPDVPVEMKVHVDGYVDWYYPNGDPVRSSFLVLKSSQILPIKVKVFPDTKQ